MSADVSAEDEVGVWPDSLRMGLDRFAAGGGFNLSVIPVDILVPSGFFHLTEPESEELWWFLERKQIKTKIQFKIKINILIN